MHKDAFTEGHRYGLLITALCIAVMLVAFAVIDWAQAKQAAQIVACSAFAKF